MITVDGKWTLEGIDKKDPARLRTSGELSALIEEFGFLPLFKNHIPGFSVEERTTAKSWWSGRPEEDPWEWREVIAAEGKIAYGKLFCSRAGFISKEWYPCFAVCRRDGYDFDSRYEDGLASRRHKKIMDVLEPRETVPSYELKSLAGFHKDGEKGFEGAITALQMQTYLLVGSFSRKRNRKNEEYGWSIANYTISEKLFGEEHVRSAYGDGANEARERIIKKLKKHFPDISDVEAKIIIG